MVATNGVEPMKDAYQASIIPFNYVANGPPSETRTRY